MVKVYPVILTPNENGYMVSVPDLNIDTEGNNLADAIAMARDAIGISGISLEDIKQPIPEPSNKEPKHSKYEIVTWVDIDFAKYRLANDMTTMRVNVSVPKYLKVLADEAQLNISQELQERLKEKLCV